MTTLERTGAPKLGHFLAVSGALHVVVLICAIAMGAWSGPAVDLDRNVIKTRLVKLGKKRNEKLLPRIQRQKEKKKA